MNVMAARLEGIQWLRALAALLVVIDHAFYTLVERAGAAAGLTDWADRVGTVGVKLFFLISGAVMVLAGTRQFGPAAARLFLRRRLVRVVPLYWLLTAVYVVKLMLSGEDVSLAHVLKSLLFVPYQNAAQEMQPLYRLGWTLNYEMLFYALFALGLLHSLRVTLWGTGLLLLLLVGLGLQLPAVPGPAWAQEILFFWTRPIVLYFAAGLVLGVVLQGLQICPLRVNLSQALVIALVAVGTDLMYVARDPALKVWQDIGPLSVAVLVLASPQAIQAQGLFARAASHLGDASYSIYLIHPLVVGPAGRLFAKLGVTSVWLFALLCLVVSAMAGLLCYRWVERPMLRWFGGWNQPTAPGSRVRDGASAVAIGRRGSIH